ncbi:hypothetical protein [Bacillus smithii]|uniref:hypothetical protein n=1 Tax=Bacillus smithii TaxID=1479 RepID=UPI0022E09406|nr:hypothetical protein [Bacillus smithii]
MFSISLQWPEFAAVNQEVLPIHYLLHAEKKIGSNDVLIVGFSHPLSTTEGQEKSEIRVNKSLYLLVLVKRYRCRNCNQAFTSSF